MLALTDIYFCFKLQAPSLHIVLLLPRGHFLGEIVFDCIFVIHIFIGFYQLLYFRSISQLYTLFNYQCPPGSHG